jgi:hypothetical protein
MNIIIGHEGAALIFQVKFGKNSPIKETLLRILVNL